MGKSSKSRMRSEPGTLFRNYFWLVDKIDNAGEEGLTFEEINDAWVEDRDFNSGSEMAKRTFHNHISAIAVLFGIQISCNRVTHKYYIDPDDRYDTPGKERMMEAIRMQMAMKKYSEQFKRNYSMDQNGHNSYLISPIMSAIKESRCLSITKRLTTSQDNKRQIQMIVEPHSIKEFNNAIYLIGKRRRLTQDSSIDDSIDIAGGNRPLIIGFDSIVSCEIMKDQFEAPLEEDNLYYFSDRIGYGDPVSGHSGMKIVTLAATDINFPGQKSALEMLRENPLHYSQKEIESVSMGKDPCKVERAIFVFNIVITQDLLDILVKNPLLYPLSPYWVLTQTSY